MRKGHRYVIIGLIVVACVIGLIFAGHLLGWETGFGPEDTLPKQHAKTLWDWMQLLIIPFVLALTALLFNLANTRTEQRIAADRYKQEQQIALDKQQEDLLQTYLDRMSELLLDRNLRKSEPNDEVRKVARVRTTTILYQLDARRIGLVFAFLLETRLMSERNHSIVSFNGADLRKINLSQAILLKADLSGATMSEANLSRADLRQADLRDAWLYGADLSHADLSDADLYGANLSDADLSHADLTGTMATDEQLNKAQSLKGATMPDGSKHP